MLTHLYSYVIVKIDIKSYGIIEVFELYAINN